MKLEKLYKKIGKKFGRYYKRSYHLNGNLITFTWDPYYGLTDKEGKEIIVKLVSKKECYHQWRWYNFWCQECGEFTNNKNHGVMVHQCFKCGQMWDRENGNWSKEETENLFFNMTYRTK